MQVAALRATNQAQAEQLARLVARVEELERQNKRDSWNSGNPPSSDPIYTEKTKAPAKDRSARERGVRKPGKQPGEPDTTMKLVDNPDERIECPPAACSGCGADLSTAPVEREQRRQVTEAQAAPAAEDDRVRGAGQGVHVLRDDQRGRACGICLLTYRRTRVAKDASRLARRFRKFEDMILRFVTHPGLVSLQRQRSRGHNPPRENANVRFRRVLADTARTRGLRARPVLSVHRRQVGPGRTRRSPAPVHHRTAMAPTRARPTRNSLTATEQRFY